MPNSWNIRSLRAGVASSALALVTSAAHAKLGNLAYEASEVGVPLASFNETTFTGPPGGSNTVLMLRDVMIVMGSHDSGVPDGPLHVFDVEDPKQPVLLKRFTSAETAELRELHAMPVAVIDGKDILVFPTISGVRFFDFSDPLNPEPLGALELEGVNGGDYDNAAWMTSWAWPYVYVGGTGNGIYVVDAHDPEAPTLVTRIQTGESGGFRIGPVYAAGNYIIASGMDATPTEVAVLDAGDPESPFLLAKGSAPAAMYSALVIGDRVYGSGEGGNYSFLKWSADTVEAIGGALKLGADKGGYCTYQDAFVFCGQSSEGYRKIDVSDEQNIAQVSQANIDVEGADSDFATVLGNIVYLGNDHGSGAAFFAHDMAPDATPPEFLKGYPEDGALLQPLTTRVTLFFSDEIDIDTMTAESIVVRPVGGDAIDGVFSHSSFNAVSFGAKQPLLADTTYEVVILAGGLADLAQNPIAGETVTRFSTGNTIELPAGTGGSGGMSAGGSSGSGGNVPDNGGAPTSSAGTDSGTAAGSGGTEAGGGPANPGAQPSSAAEEDGACGCRTPGRRRGSTGLALLALAGLGLCARARRRGRLR
ncbi:MAG TPA: Ig-like domain-containing protein [Polyangiaceae bacterium]|nr:Ig-like domain-containing protein [Polyangiaceae bacterium]